MAIQNATPSILVLASGSPRRAEILRNADIEFDVVPTQIDEDRILATGGALSDAVQRLARAKAESVAVARPGEYVLGADTIVVLEGNVLGKPANSVQAKAMLNRLSGNGHSVLTGVAIVDSTGNCSSNYVDTSVTFRSLDEEVIASYVESGSPLDKAGGYGIQDHSFDLVASYDDCYLNVVGLPMCATGDLLIESGFCDGRDFSCPSHARSDASVSRVAR